MGRSLVEPALWEDAPNRFNPLHRSTGTLIGDDMRLKPCVCDMIDVSLAGYVICVDSIVLEVAYSLVISSSSKFINVIGEDLPNTFNEVQNSNLPAGPLHDPNSHSVRFGPSSTNVKEGAVAK